METTRSGYIGGLGIRVQVFVGLGLRVRYETSLPSRNLCFQKAEHWQDRHHELLLGSQETFA